MKKSDVIYSKQPLIWYEAWLYLDMGNILGAISDEGFRERLEDLENYVYKKIELPNDSDIIDTYVVVEQKKEKISQNG